MIKKLSAIFLAAVLCLIGINFLYADEGETAAADKAVKMDIRGYGEAGETLYKITGYQVNERLCLAPQDLSYILKDTDYRFALGSDFGNNSAWAKTSGEYTGNEPALKTGDTNPEYAAFTLSFAVDGAIFEVPSYRIDGAVYSEIRSLGEALGFELIWNGEEKSISLTTLQEDSKAVDGEKVDNETADGEELENDEADGAVVLAVIYASKAAFSVSGKPVCFTFDDGPTPENTDRLLAALTAVGGHGTFFVVGERVVEYPELISHIVNQGSQVGNHSYSHATLTALGTAGVQSQIFRTSNAVYDAAGIYPYIGRAPGGSINSTVKNAINIAWFNWNLDTND